MPRAPDLSIEPLPHDWTFQTWPAGVYPYDGKKAKHLVRQYQEELRRCGALARPGHVLVIFARPYLKWLASTARRVSDDYLVAANQPAHAAKRFGGGRRGRTVEAPSTDDAA